MKVTTKKVDADFHNQQVKAGAFGMCKLENRDENGNHTVKMMLGDKVVEGTVEELAELLPESCRDRFTSEMKKFDEVDDIIQLSAESSQMWAYLALAVNYISKHLLTTSKESVPGDILRKLAEALKNDPKEVGSDIAPNEEAKGEFKNLVESREDLALESQLEQERKVLGPYNAGTLKTGEREPDTPIVPELVNRGREIS